MIRLQSALIRAACLCSAMLGACSDERNFSQYSGFAEWYAAHPPSDALPDPAERALLARYKPRVFLPEGHEGPINFYRDYIAQGHFVGDEQATETTQKALNRVKAEPRVVFEHVPEGVPPEPVIYGRIDRAALPGCSPITFLTYNLVFRHSGLPAGLSWWQAVGLGLAGDLDDWHQLDHYTAVTLALDDQDGDLVPLAVTFQHHNYMRTYLLGDEVGAGWLALPDDGRLAVDVAVRSNELYPHQEGRTDRRAVSFMSPQAAGYLITGENPPWRAADDVTDPAREVDPELVFLPPSDAFYVFQGWLGERRRLPGRDSPPGADYNTLPPFKDKAVQLAAFYWHEGDADYLELLENLFADGRPQQVDIGPFAERVAGDLGGTTTLACADQEQPSG